MDNSIKIQLAVVEERNIGDDLVSEELGIDSQPSDKINDSEAAPVTTREEKKQETENIVALSEPETNSSLVKPLEELSELDIEKEMRLYEFNIKTSEDRNVSDNTPEKQPQYNYSAEKILKSIYQNSDVSINSSTVQLLTDGFMKRFVPSLLKAQSSITQIKSSQSVLIETVQQETSKFTDFRSVIDLKETYLVDLTRLLSLFLEAPLRGRVGSGLFWFTNPKAINYEMLAAFTFVAVPVFAPESMVRAKQYHNKLLKIRKDMTDLYEKSRRLKKRALKLQQQKQKEELTRAHSMEKEFEKERMLTARVALSHD